MFTIESKKSELAFIFFSWSYFFIILKLNVDRLYEVVRNFVNLHIMKKRIKINFLSKRI